MHGYVGCRLKQVLLGCEMTLKQRGYIDPETVLTQGNTPTLARVKRGVCQVKNELKGTLPFELSPTKMKQAMEMNGAALPLVEVWGTAILEHREVVHSSISTVERSRVSHFVAFRIGTSASKSYGKVMCFLSCSPDGSHKSITQLLAVIQPFRTDKHDHTVVEVAVVKDAPFVYVPIGNIVVKLVVLRVNKTKMRVIEERRMCIWE
jgi:hypothetical protein